MSNIEFWEYEAGPSEARGAGGTGAPKNCQTVLYFLYNSVQNVKQYNWQPHPPIQYELCSDSSVKGKQRRCIDFPKKVDRVNLELQNSFTRKETVWKE